MKLSQLGQLFFRQSSQHQRSNATSVSYDQACGPFGRTIIAIGDIHGQLSALEKLLKKISAENFDSNTEKIYVFLGDYIDRGPSSKGVIDRLLDWSSKHKTIFLKGNHEAIFLDFLEKPTSTGQWLSYGGLETLIDYGVIPEAGAKKHSDLFDLRERLLENLPESHLSFFNRLRLSYGSGDFMFVHAGVNPKIPVSDNTEEDLLWIRGHFLGHRGLFEKLIVHGHTITMDGRPEIKPNRVGIDTGSYVNGTITAMIIEGENKYFINSKLPESFNPDHPSSH